MTGSNTPSRARRPRHLGRPEHGARAGQRGFTMTEVMMSLVIFMIALVGLVATQSRGIEAQQSALELREAERIAQRTMGELQAMGFDELATQRFDGVAQFPPYADTPGNAGTRILVDFNGTPVDDPTISTRPGVREQFFAVYRRVDPVPITALTADALDGVALTVQVMWLDTTNPSFPPPALATVAGLEPSMVDPADVADFRGYVRSVELRTVRINDNGTLPGAVGAPLP